MMGEGAKVHPSPPGSPEQRDEEVGGHEDTAGQDPVADAEEKQGEPSKSLFSFVPPCEEVDMNQFVEKSLHCIPRANVVRRYSMKLVHHPWFGKFIFAFIVANSIILALVDYKPQNEDSVRNKIVESTEMIFTSVFLVECVLKIIAFGLVHGENTYLRDPWNCLDFVVVGVGVIGLIPGMVNLSVLRTFRVLRPLRSLSRFPGLRRLVSALLNSIPQLLDVILLLIFVLMVFSILGVQFFSGLLHSRCRLTPYPVTLNPDCLDSTQPCWEEYLYNVTTNPKAYRCLDDHNYKDSWTKESSPWNKQRDCLWPSNPYDTRVCSRETGGFHRCGLTDVALNGQLIKEVDATCGSNYDNVGNPRFLNKQTPYGVGRVDSETFIFDLNWGYTYFDNIATAFLAIFQSVTMEGWVEIMYMCQDAYNSGGGAMVFIILILFGSFFMLNLVLAVITDCVKEQANSRRSENREKEKQAQEEVDKRPPVIPEEIPEWRQFLLRIVEHSYFTGVIMTLIVMNTVVLAMDHHGMDSQLENTLELINLLLAFAFLLEMVINIAALTFKTYISDAFYCFDGFIVVMSMVEIIAAVVGGGAGGSGISALRTFRLFRLFKLAKGWSSFQTLLKTILETVMEIGNFAVLLLLFMYIYALVGMQFFAYKMNFNEDSGARDDDHGKTPRSNFDTLLWALVTIFQVLTGENWNLVMYDAWRATGWYSTLYFLTLVVFGGFIVMNLFLAILLSNFEGNEDLIKADEVLNAPSKSTRRDNKGMIGKFSHSIRRLQYTAQASLSDFSARSPAGSASPGTGTSNDGTFSLGASTKGTSRSRPYQVAPGSEGPGNNDSKMEQADAEDDMANDARSIPLNNMGVGARGAAVAPAPEGHESNPNAGSRDEEELPQNLEEMHLDEGSICSVGSGGELPPVDTGPASAGSGPGSRGGSSAKVAPAAESNGLAAKMGDGGTGTATTDMDADLEGGRAKGATATEAEDEVSHDKMVWHEHPDQMPWYTRGIYNLFLFHERNVDKTLYLVGPENELRQRVSRMVEHPYFDHVIIGLILVSSVILAVDNPLMDPKSTFVRFVRVFDLIMTVAFSIEAGLKIFALGFMLNEGAYLDSGWNVLDFTIVVISILSVGDVGPGSSLRALRVVRVLRPLRVISRRPELKLVVNALLSSIPAIVNVMIVCLLFFLIFAIVGVSYLKGTFYSCQGDDYDALNRPMRQMIDDPVRWDDMTGTEKSWFDGAECNFMRKDIVPTSKQICMCLKETGDFDDLKWARSIPQSFDNVFFAMGTLYEISTTEGWLDVMLAAVDNNGVDMQPLRNNQEAWVIFFIGFMVVGAFFIMNLFVGVVIDNFNEIRQRKKGAVFMTSEQEEWARTQAAVLQLKPKRRLEEPEEKMPKICYQIMSDPRFDKFIIGCIIVNSGVLGLQYFGQEDWYGLLLEVINYIFALIFTLEAAIKLTAAGWSWYWYDGWNRFDFVIVLGTISGLVVQWTTSTNVGSIASVIRMFRVGRIFRLINSAKSLRQLFNTLVTSLPSLTNIGGLLGLLFFIYAVCGVQLYAKTQHDDENVTEHANFTNFGMAMLTLFRFSTGENWNGFMHSLASRQPGCEGDPKYNDDWCENNGYKYGCEPVNGCGTWSVYPFFYSFTLIVTFVMLNLFIGVILESFSKCDEEGVQLSAGELDLFTDAWAHIDPDATCFIGVEQLGGLLSSLEKPWGFMSKHSSPQDLQDRIANLDIPIRDRERHRVHFNDVARALSREIMLQAQGAKFRDLPIDHQLNQELAEIIGDSGHFTTRKYFSMNREALVGALGNEDGSVAGAGDGNTDGIRADNAAGTSPTPNTQARIANDMEVANVEDEHDEDSNLASSRTKLTPLPQKQPKSGGQTATL